jgi:hypothetical protein
VVSKPFFKCFDLKKVYDTPVCDRTLLRLEWYGVGPMFVAVTSGKGWKMYHDRVVAMAN